MKILVIGKEERLRHYTADVSVFDEFQIVYAPVGATDEELLKTGQDADFIIVDAIGRVSGAVISKMPNLKLIHSEGVGFQGIDIEAARDRKIYVCNCKGMNATAVAEQGILLMLGLLRNVCTGDRDVRSGRQIVTKEAYMKAGSLKELGDCTIGLVGFGDIAKETARLLAAFGAKVIYYNRTKMSKEVEAQYRVTYHSLGEVLAESDIVSLHVPVTAETTNMVNESFFAGMKKGALLINTARGELVDSQALIQAMRSGQVAGAGIDTLPNEPVKKDNPLLDMGKELEDRFLFSCHIGGITGSSFKRGYQMVWEDIRSAAEGKEPKRIVNQW